jgi:hypothetical protein
MQAHRRAICLASKELLEIATMRTRLQQYTSRVNGGRSRGPTSPQGRLNADQAKLTHGLTAKAHAIIPGEDPHDLADFVQRLCEELNPVGELQNEIFGRLASACTLRRRGDRA